MPSTQTKYESEPSRRQAANLLQKVWGHSDFRGGQWSIIEAVLRGRDVVGVLPTGTGKSVCYQLPAALGSGLTLVISPLIALIRDQVESLSRRGVGATFIDSSVGSREADQRLTDCRFGKYRLLYVAPERLRSGVFMERCRDLPLKTVAVDEAHCISEWGQSFRPAYLEIADALSDIGRPPVVALTATATPAVRRDIEKWLRLVDPVRVVGGFDRPNIIWSVFKNRNKRKRVEAVLRSVEGSGIIYAATRREADAWAAWLNANGVGAEAYHAGLPRSVRDDRHGRWMSGESRVIAATNAFGMGIDKADVRFVIHVNLSSGLESYYQEAGRAGRDGLKSYAVLLYNDGDETVQEALVRRSFPETNVIRGVFETACSLNGVAIGSIAGGPLDLDIEDVARAASMETGAVRGAIDYLERNGWFSILDQPNVDGHLRLTNIGGLRTLAESGSATAVSRVALGFLRQGYLLDVPERWSPVRTATISGFCGVSPEDVLRALAFFSASGIAEWRPSGDGLQLLLNAARPARLPLDERLLKRGRRAARSRLREMLDYVNSRTCRRERILAYFGETSSSGCGRCDICIRKSAPSRSMSAGSRTSESVIRFVRSGTPRHRWPIGSDMDDESVDRCLDSLIREGHVRVSPALDGTFELTESGEKLG